MQRSCLRAILLVLSLSVVARPVDACQPPESPATFVINHETHGNIGTHVLTFACEGEDLIVATEVDVKVKILFVTVYEREARYREVWRDDQLIAYEARTNDGGDHYVTTAKIDGPEMVIDGVEKGQRVPLDTVSSHPWNVDVVKRPLIFGQRDGQIHEVSVKEAETEIVTIGGKRIEAQKFVVSGSLERELLYAPDGTWLQWRLERDGKTVSITRQ